MIHSPTTQQKQAAACYVHFCKTETPIPSITGQSTDSYLRTLSFVFLYGTDANNWSSLRHSRHGGQNENFEWENSWIYMQ